MGLYSQNAQNVSDIFMTTYD